MPNEKKIYPELLYFRTKVLKMSVEDVIKGTDMSSATYLRCEKGVRELTLGEAYTIAENMGLDLETLFPKIFGKQVDKTATNNKEI